MDKQKINLMIIIGGLHHGGAERVIESLCHHLDPERYNITVCWRDARGDIGQGLVDQGFDLVGIREHNPDVSPYLRFLVLRKILKDRNIHVVHTHDDGSLADAVQCRLSGSKVRLIHTFHFGNYPKLKGKQLWMVRVLSRFMDQLVAVGFEQEKLIRKYLYLERSNIKTIYNGVEMPRDTAEKIDLKKYLWPFNKPPVVIGSISTLTEQKGLRILIQSASCLKQNNVEFLLLVAGGGPLENELKNMAIELGLEKSVVFLGWVPNAADRLLKEFDIFCQSSLWEANSIVLLEAMSSGSSIVTTDVGESRHVVDHEQNGLIVEPGNAELLAAALERLIKSPELRKNFGQAAKKKFLENYTVGKMVATYQREYEKLFNA